MALLSFILQNPLQLLVVFVAAIPIYHVLAWLNDEHGLRAIDGPWIAALSDAWLGYWAAKGQRSENVHKMHQKYGKVVRIAPNHVSISEPEALQVVYAHGNGTTKSEFYDAFVANRTGLFSTRSRAEHTRKRKIVSHIFSQKHVLEFENNARAALGKLITQWDRMCKGGALGHSGREADGWFGKDGWAWFDVLPWYNYLAFDIIGDLAFGSPFGMLDAAKDIAPVAVPAKDGGLETIYIPAVEILNKRGDFNASIGVLPKWSWPLIKRIPWYARGKQAVQHLTGMAVAAVEKRLADPSAAERGDLLAKLQEGKDDDGNPMGKEELIAETLTQLIAGSDTTSNSSCGITYHLAKYPRIQRKLQAELDDILGTEEGVVHFDSVKQCKYLEACINESLRLHSVSAVGLPRLVPEGGLNAYGIFFKEGTVLSVPSYTIHRDKRVWGEDVEEYRPERWFEGNLAAMQAAFNPFSYGPRACVGRYLAMMELFIIIATAFRRYDFVLETPDKAMVLREGFLRKPLSMRVGMKRRNV